MKTESGDQSAIQEFENQKHRSRDWSNDMSPQAIMQRLEIVSEVYDTWRVLQKGKLAGDRYTAGKTSRQDTQ